MLKKPTALTLTVTEPPSVGSSSAGVSSHSVQMKGTAAEPPTIFLLAAQLL